MKIETPKIVQGRSWTVYFWPLLPLLLFLVYQYSQEHFSKQMGHADLQVDALEQSRDQLQRQLTELEDERMRLQTLVAALQRTAQIDREATRQVREELKQRLVDQSKLQQELQFLKRIVDNGVESKGLYIQGFRLEQISTLEDNAFRFQFTVSKALKISGLASGWIYVTLEGETDEGEKSYSLQELLAEGDDKLKMQFRHFQDVNRVIHLPQGFVPHSVVVEVKPKNKSLSSIKKRFGWLVVS